MKNIFDEEELELDDIIGEKNEYHLKEVEIFEIAIEREDDNDEQSDQGKEEIKIDNEKNENDSSSQNDKKRSSNNSSDENRTDEENNGAGKKQNSIKKNYDNIREVSFNNSFENEKQNDNNGEFMMTGIIKGTKY